MVCCCGLLNVEGLLLSNTSKDKDILADNEEAAKLYQIYIRVQSGDNTALNELFQETDGKQICRADEMNKEYRMSHMDNILDSESVIDNEKNKQDEEWIGSVYSKVSFQFSCLNKMLYKKKKKFLSRAKNTGFENGKKSNSGNDSKFYEGEYDISDFNELAYETVIEVFHAKTDENNCLTLDGKKNIGVPICNGVSLLKNISYFISRKINKRAEVSFLDIYDMVDYSEESETEISYFDKYVFRKFSHAEGGMSRLTMYAEYLEWLKRNDLHRLFKVTACDIKAIIETIMYCDETFIPNASGDIETGFGMRFVGQKTLQGLIKLRCNRNIEQENISKDIEIIEQRLLDHLLYSLNYRIGRAEKSMGIYEKESERFLYGLDKKGYIKIFSRAGYELYDKSIRFIHCSANSNDCDKFFKLVQKYEDMVMNIVSLEKGKKKYDMVNFMVPENNDLVDDKRAAILNIAHTIIEHYQKAETEYQRNVLGKYKMQGFSNWKNGYWEAELCNDILKIRLFSSGKIKKPIQYNINREKLIVYSGCMNLYFCDVQMEMYYKFPKNRRIISRSNQNHKIFMYKVG